MIFTDNDSPSPPPPYVIMRNNGDNIIIPFADETPTPPYIAAMLGGKVRYAPLVPVSSANRINNSKGDAVFILRSANTNSDTDLLAPMGTSRNDYGEGTVNLSAYFQTSSQYPAAIYPAANYPYKEEVRTYDDDDNNPLTPLPIDLWPDFWSDVTWELDVSAEILLVEDNVIYASFDGSGSSLRYIVNNYNYDPWGISDDEVFRVGFPAPAGSSILIHHSKCKVDNPSPEVNAKKGKWAIAKIISSEEWGPSEEHPAYGLADRFCKVTLDRTVDIDLDNFHVQIVPFIDLQALTVCKGLTIKPSSYGEDYTGARHGGIVALRCCGSTESSPASGSYGKYYRAVGIEFMGGYIDMRDANLPDGNNGVFIFAPTCTVYDSKYENQPEPYNNYILT